jgi:hypothetical protein
MCSIDDFGLAAEANMSIKAVSMIFHRTIDDSSVTVILVQNVGSGIGPKTGGDATCLPGEIASY